MHIERGRIFDSSLRKSVPLGSTKMTTCEKSAEIAQDVERFLRSGGKIVQLPGYHPKPKPPHRAALDQDKAPDEEPIRRQGRDAVIWHEALRVKDRLFEAGLTYKALAEAAGVPKRTLERWIKKMMIPSNAWKARVADALQVLLAKHHAR